MPGILESDIPGVVSEYFSHIVDTNASTDDLVRYSRLIDMIRHEAGQDLFDRVYSSLLSGNQSIASSLAPTPRFTSKQCRKCETYRLFHMFCHYCGSIFDIKSDCLKAVATFLEYRKTFEKCIIENKR